MDLRSTIPALELVDNPSIKGFRKKIIPSIIKLLEFWFGTKILLEIPQAIQKFSPELFRALNIAAKLKSLGAINEIRQLSKRTDEPFMFRFVAHSTLPIKTANGCGVSFFNEEEALWRSLGEATERFLWFSSPHFFENSLIKSSPKKLGGKAMDISQLSGFSSDQRKKIGIINFDENSIFNWMPAKSLTPSEEEKLCPVQLLSSSYMLNHVKTFHNNNSRKEPMLRWQVTTGLATGKILDEAIVKGFLEVIERDAFMVTYLNKISPPVLDLEHLSDQDSDISAVLKKFKRYNLEIFLIELPSDFSMHIIGAIIIDRTKKGPAFSIGISADFDLKNCILDSISESHAIRLSIKDTFKDGLKVDEKNFKREDRLIYWSNIYNLPRIEFLISGPKKEAELKQNFYEIEKESSPKDYYAKKIEELSKQFKNNKCRAYFVEITTPEIKKLGFRCIYALSPDLQPLHLDERIPYFGGKRLKDLPVKLGYEPAEKLNNYPQPFP